MRRIQAALTALLTFSAFALVLAPAAHGATTIHVTTAVDELIADGDCSLREAVVAANGNAAFDDCPAGTGADRIVLKATTYQLKMSGPNENSSLTGDLDIVGNLTIKGAGAGATTINAGLLSDRILEMHSGDLRLSSLRISGGYAPLDGSSARTSGGGVLKHFGLDLTLDHVTVSGNSATATGGGVASLASPDSGPPPPAGITTINNSTFVGNESDNDVGGGLSSVDEAKVVMSHSAFTINGGGGIEMIGTTKVNLTDIKASQNLGPGIRLIVTDKATLSNITASRNYNAGDGLVLIATAQTTVKKVEASGNSGSGVEAIAVNTTELNKIHATDNDGYGVQLVAPFNATMSGITATDNGSSGVELVAPVDFEMDRIATARNAQSGLNLIAPVRNKMQDVSATNNDGPGISMSAPFETRMRTITASRNGDTGIAMTAPTDTRITGAKADQNAGNGIYLLAPVDTKLTDITVSDNHASSAGATSSLNGGGISMVAPNGTTFSNVTAKNNRADLTGGGVDLQVPAFTDMTNMVVKGNSAKGRGGGMNLFASYITTITRARVTSNTSKGSSGGGLYLLAPASTVLKDSAISGNKALGNTPAGSGEPPSGSGGGLFVLFGFDTRILSSTISGNLAAAHGGGVFGKREATTTDVDTTISNSTVSGNASGNGVSRKGGGLYFENSVLSLLNSTIYANKAKASGGGIFARLIPEDPPDGDPNNDPQMLVTSKNTIVAKQRGGGECAGSGTFASAGPNLGSNATCFTGPKVIRADPKLAPLSDNGGPTLTHALLPGSPARNAGSNNGCLSKDQRGKTRPRTNGNPCDIGSVEMGRPASGSASRKSDRDGAHAGRTATGNGMGTSSCKSARRDTNDRVYRRAMKDLASAFVAPRRDVRHVKSRVTRRLERTMSSFGDNPRVKRLLGKAQARIDSGLRPGQLRFINC